MIVTDLLDDLFSTDDPCVLELDLDRGLLMTAPDSPLAAVRSINTPTLATIVARLREASADGRVAGLIVHIGTCPISLAAADELGEAIEAFGSRKPTVAHAESFGELTNGVNAYRLATRAGRVWVQPSGQLALGGVHLDLLLLRGGFENLHLEPQFAQRKEYKTAANTYTATEITEPHREMMQRIADSIVEQTVALVARRRGLDPGVVRSTIDGPALSADEAAQRGFVDRVGYRDEVYADVRATWGADARLLYAQRYSGSIVRRAVDQLSTRRRPIVSVVDVHGAIVSGRGGASMPGGSPQAAAEVVCGHLRAACRDDQVKAVVLRVDSPGGSYIASDTIRREVLQVRASGRTVVAAMGDVAASGGYFVAMGAQEIVATPSTLTGSIGVLAGKLVTQGLYERLGLVREDVQAGARADFMTGNRRYSDEQWAELNAWLDVVYADFTAKAAADRSMSVDDLEPLARGRVWTGADAHERGLVDRLGGWDLAVERACALAEIDRAKAVVRAPAVPGFLARFKPAESSESVAAHAARPVTPEGMLRSLLAAVGVEAPGVLSLPWRIRLT